MGLQRGEEHHNPRQAQAERPQPAHTEPARADQHQQHHEAEKEIQGSRTVFRLSCHLDEGIADQGVGGEVEELRAGREDLAPHPGWIESGNIEVKRVARSQMVPHFSPAFNRALVW